MAMTAPVFEILSATPAVTALVPATRIRGSGYGGEAPTVPYITHQTISGVPESYVGNRPGIDRHRAQIDCWASSASQAKAIAAACQYALEVHGTTELMIDDVEVINGSPLYRIGIDFTAYTRR